MNGREHDCVVGPLDVLDELRLTGDRNPLPAKALRRRIKKNLSKPDEALLGHEAARGGFPAIEPLVVTRRIDHGMSKSVELIPSAPIHRVAARPPEDVTDADDRRQVMGVEILEDESEPELFPPVVRRVSHHSE